MGYRYERPLEFQYTKGPLYSSHPLTTVAGPWIRQVTGVSIQSEVEPLTWLTLRLRTIVGGVSLATNSNALFE
jgi:hypothetical protein